MNDRDFELHTDTYRCAANGRLRFTQSQAFSPVNATEKVSPVGAIQYIAFSQHGSIFAMAAAKATRSETGAAANGARREADRKRRTVIEHWLREIFFSEQ